jgi:hypothetical protein
MNGIQAKWTDTRGTDTGASPTKMGSVRNFVFVSRRDVRGWGCGRKEDHVYDGALGFWRVGVRGGVRAAGHVVVG